MHNPWPMQQPHCSLRKLRSIQQPSQPPSHMRMAYRLLAMLVAACSELIHDARLKSTSNERRRVDQLIKSVIHMIDGFDPSSPSRRVAMSVDKTKPNEQQAMRLHCQSLMEAGAGGVGGIWSVYHRISQHSGMRHWRPAAFATCEATMLGNPDGHRLRDFGHCWDRARGAPGPGTDGCSLGLDCVVAW